MFTKERSATLSLATIMAFRMLGLFMILPVFSVVAEQLPGATATLVGIALGIYGLTQALLQMPFGMLSDRIGRKPIITVGLILFAIGSVVAACSHTIYGIILGRALQGAGAIGSTTLAMAADLTRDENRTKAMAFMGLTIGFAFSLAMVFGPIINTWFHLSGIFWVTAGLAMIGILLLYTSVPTPTRITHQNTKTDPVRLKAILKNPQLLRLDAGILLLHAMLTALFIAIPILFTRLLQLTETQQVLLYLVVLIFAFLTMVPLIIIAEKKRKMKPIFILAICTLVITQLLLLFFQRSTIGITIILLLFFSAFTLLEASLPSLVSKISPIRNKGTAMGLYSTSQFLGIFIGGSLGGWIYGQYHIEGLFIFCALLGLIWLTFATSMQQPPYLSTLTFGTEQWNNKDPGGELVSRLKSMPGVAEVALIAHEALIYLKVDKKIADKDELRKLIEEGNLP